MATEPTPHWRRPEEIIAIGFARAQVVMMNEAHSGPKRCIRTREIGRRILPTAHECGVRHFALEALTRPFAEECNRTRRVPAGGPAYLSQPDMQGLIQAGLDLGWTVLAYEADPADWLYERYGIHLASMDTGQELNPTLQPFQAELLSLEYTNWRERRQADNLSAILQALPDATKLLVWCGNGHNTKVVIQDWMPMGYQFQRASRLEPFAIDQTRTVKFDFGQDHATEDLSLKFAAELQAAGGTAGFLREEAPASLLLHSGLDAWLLSLHNGLE